MLDKNTDNTPTGEARACRSGLEAPIRATQDRTFAMLLFVDGTSIIIGMAEYLGTAGSRRAFSQCDAASGSLVGEERAELLRGTGPLRCPKTATKCNHFGALCHNEVNAEVSQQPQTVLKEDEQQAVLTPSAVRGPTGWLF